METNQLKQLAELNRSRKEIGTALLFAFAVLAFFLAIPTDMREESPAAVILAAPPEYGAFDSIELTARAAIVYDSITGETLYEKNSDAQLPLASLIKLLTVYAAFSKLDPASLITVRESGSSVYPPRAFTKGQIFKLEDIASLTMVASLNDGALALAEEVAKHSGKSIHETLTSVATQTGLRQTYALNGTGLDVNSIASGGYGSARDMARLAILFAERLPVVARATTQTSVQAHSLGGTAFSVRNTNPYTGVIPQLLLSKTGFTLLAGGNLVLVIDVGMRHPVVIVVLGSTEQERFADAHTLVLATLKHFANFSSK